MSNRTNVAYIQPTGNMVTGVSVSDNMLLGVSTLNQLEQFGLIRPSLVESATIRQMKADKHLAATNTIREQVQRRFDKHRVKRAEDYSFYIDGVSNGTLMGGTPPLTLYCPMDGVIMQNGVLLKYGAPIVNLDGETQTEARFMRRDRAPDTGDELISVVLYHGIDPHHAGNIMHDFNRYAHPVAERVVASLNHNGSVSRAVNLAISEANIQSELINRHGSNVKRRHITSFSRLVAGAIGAATGGNALKRGAIPRLTAQYNHGNTSIQVDVAKDFLVGALRLAASDKTIGKSPDAVWALAGAFSTLRGRLITQAEFAAATAAFGSVKGSDKLQAAANAIGYGGI